MRRDHSLDLRVTYLDNCTEDHIATSSLYSRPGAYNVMVNQRTSAIVYYASVVRQDYR